MDGHRDKRQTVDKMDGRMEGWADRQVDRWTDEQTGRHTDDQMDELLDN
jgi:hypothetical protein